MSPHCYLLRKVALVLFDRPGEFASYKLLKIFCSSGGLLLLLINQSINQSIYFYFG